MTNYKTRYVENAHGREIDFDAACIIMDDDVMAAVHAELAPCTPQEFFDAYAISHFEEFGEEWELTKRSPQW